MEPATGAKGFPLLPCGGSRGRIDLHWKGLTNLRAPAEWLSSVFMADLPTIHEDGTTGSGAIHGIVVQPATAELTDRQPRRLAVTSVAGLVAANTHNIEQRNRDSQPFVWTASVRSIIAKVSKANETLATLH